MMTITRNLFVTHTGGRRQNKNHQRGIEPRITRLEGKRFTIKLLVNISTFYILQQYLFF